jgi:hypothetical protein
MLPSCLLIEFLNDAVGIDGRAAVGTGVRGDFSIKVGFTPNCWGTGAARTVMAEARRRAKVGVLETRR